MQHIISIFFISSNGFPLSQFPAGEKLRFYKKFYRHIKTKHTCEHTHTHICMHVLYSSKYKKLNFFMKVRQRSYDPREWHSDSLQQRKLQNEVVKFRMMKVIRKEQSFHLLLSITLDHKFSSPKAYFRHSSTVMVLSRLNCDTSKGQIRSCFYYEGCA